VSYSEAKKLFDDPVKILAENEKGNHSKRLKLGYSIVMFLGWIKRKRSRQTFATRKLYCTRFSNFEVRPVARMAGTSIVTIERSYGHLRKARKHEAMTYTDANDPDIHHRHEH